MELRELVLENFKTFKVKTVINFTTGLNLLCLPNGKGKSTIIEALNLLLYNQGASSYEKFINWDRIKNWFYTKLSFEHDGREYIISLEYDKSGKTGSSKKILLENGTKIAEDSDVVKEMARLFDPVVSSNAMFSLQNQNQIVNIQDSERRELIKKVQDLDYSKIVSTEIEPIITTTKSDIIENDKVIYACEQKTFEPSKEADLPYSQNEVNQFNTDIDILDKAIMLQHKANEDFLKKKDEKAILENSIASKNTQILSKARLVETNDLAISNLSFASNEICSLESEISDMQIKIDNNYDTTELDSEINSLKANVSNIVVKRMGPFDSSKMNEINQTIAVLKNNKNNAEKDLILAKSGKCPTCKKNFLPEEIITYETSLSDIIADITKKENNLIVEEELLATHNKSVVTNDINRNKRDELNKLIESKQNQIESLKQNLIQKLDSNKLILQEKKNSSETRRKSLIDNRKSLAEDLCFLNEELCILNSKLEGLETEINSFNNTDITTEKDRLIDLKTKIRKYTEGVVSNKTIAEANEALIKAEKENIKNLQIANSKKIELSNKLLEYETSKAILLKDFPNYVISQTLLEIEDSMNNFINNVYYKELNVQFKQNKSSLGLVYGTGKKKSNVRDGLSGCEQQLVQIAFIGAFNQKLNLQCLVLDEPDSAMDEKNSTNLYDILGNELNGMFSQLIIITHNKLMREQMINNFDAIEVKIV